MRNAFTAMLLAGTALAAPAWAQTTATPAADQVPGATPGDGVADETVQDTIIVTGTRAANRTAADSPVPIDVISAETLQTSGLGETNKILNQLIPSFNFPQPSINDGTDVIRPATLRGLNPDQTLILINGKRRHTSALLNINGSVGRGAAAVDINTIPALALERVEVLRDGASSQYGSDAIAGVINFQLKRGTNTGTLQVSYGKYVTQLEGVGDLTGLQTNAAGQPFFDPADSRVLAGNFDGERRARDGDLWTIAANIGVPIGEEGYLNLTGEYRDRDNTNRAGFDTRPNYNRPTAAFDARELTFDRLNFEFGDPRVEDYNFFANAGLPLGAVEFYAFGSYTKRNAISAANFRQSSSANNRDFSAITPATTPSTANFVPLRPDGFLPSIATDYTDYAAAAGLRADVAGFSADLSVVYGHNELDYRTVNSLNTSFGPQSQRDFDSGGLRFGQTTVNLDLRREFDVGFAKPLTFAFGGEYRDENFKIVPGEGQSYLAGPFFVSARNTTAADCSASGGLFNAGRCTFPGRGALVGAQGFPGLPASAATDRSRDSFAGYLELDTDIFEGFTVTAAGRFERFSDFGETVNGKLAARWEFVPGLAVRGSVSNGFRAPSLQQQFFTTTSTNFIAGEPVEISTLSVDSPVAQALGARPLDAEKSFNLSFGATANPLRGLNVTVDVYQIKITDRIVLTENLGAVGSGTAAVNAAVQQVLLAGGFASVGAARFFINGLDTTTRGLDAVAVYRFGLGGLGNWSLTAAYNYNQNKIDERLNALGPLAQIPGLVLFGRVEGIRFTDGQPEDKLVLSADGSVGAFGITARTTRYGEVVSPGAATPISAPTSLTAAGPDDLRLAPKWITDLELRYTFKEHVTFALGANNLFDVYPTRRPTGARPASVGGNYPVDAYYQPYSTFSPFGFNGRFLYGRFTAQF
jgi:iron complex outermembrane receptor protein